MAKKKTAGKKAAKKARKRPERSKGGFGVFIERQWFPDAMAMDQGGGEACLVQIAHDLNDRQDAIRWIKENADDHEGGTLVIAQVKARLTCSVKKLVQVKIEEV